MLGVLRRLTILAITLCALAGTSAAQPPNILWIYTDDQSDDAGFYGTPALNTPNMDALAASGVTYSNAYVTSPGCSTSRTAMMTGVYQTSLPLAMHHRPSSRQPLPSGIQPISDYFRQAGYFVGNASSNFTGQGKFDMNFARPDGSALQFSDLFDGTDWRQAGSAPWFMQVNLFEPHRSFRGQNTDLSRRDALHLPDDLPDHPIARADYADYLASIEQADTKLGAVLDRLAADGLADNTLVFWIGDNGREFTRAKGAAYDAGVHVPLVARIPQSLQAGRTDLAAGFVQESLVSALDVTAASLAAAGIDLATLPQLHGQDLLAADYQRDSVVTALDRQANSATRARTVRTGDMLYIRNYHTDLEYFGEDSHWYSKQQRPIHTLMEVMRGRGLKTAADGLVWADSRPDEELYDLSSDPYQLNNLAEDPQQQDHLQQGRDTLLDWARRTGDRGGNFDPDLAPAQAWYNTTGRWRHLDEKGLPRDTTDYEYLQWWADLFNVPIDLAEGDFDLQRFRVPNQSFENESLGEGAFLSGPPNGWTDATAGVYIQNQTAALMTTQADDGSNVLLLYSGGSELRWVIDDNWGNLLSAYEAAAWADEAAAWNFSLTAAVGRRSNFQGEAPGQLRVSLQTESGELLRSIELSLAEIEQGEFEDHTFDLLIDRTLAAQFGDQPLYLALANLADYGPDGRLGRVVLDDLALQIEPLLTGDYNADGLVNQADYQLWRSSYGSTTDPRADGSGDGLVDGADYTIWRDALQSSATAIPEPRGAWLIAPAALLLTPMRIRTSNGPTVAILL